MMKQGVSQNGTRGLTVRFAVLGTLRAMAGDEPAALPPKERVVLATLLLRAGQVVSVPALANAVWDGDPPSSARNTIQGQVKRLRQALGPESGRVVTRSPGYLVEVAAGELDLWDFTGLRERAGEAAAAGAWDRAAGLLRDALALWGGDPLSDVPSAYLRRTEVPRLAEVRHEALLARIDADLRLGRHGAVTAELRGLVAGNPFRERLWEQFMLALYRDGRQGEALAAYRQARWTLRTELGIDPGPGLQELHNQILAGDPALTVTAAVTAQPGVVPAGEPGGGHQRGDVAGPGTAASAAPGAQPVVPRQLPSAVAHFAGRAGELAALDALLDDAGRTARGTVVISAVAGTAGVGKTALAVRWAHQAAGRFRDGQLYVNLRGFDPSGAPLTPGEAVRGFLDALGVPAEQVPRDPDSKAALYRSLLAGKQVLILLDNARDEQQVRPLLPAGPGCLVIITSRSRLAGLAAGEGARLLALDVLSQDEARQVLAARLGERAAAEPGAVDEIARLCGRLPLALAVAAARAAERPRLPLADLAAMLGDARGRLDALDVGDPAMNVRAVLSWSVGRLGPAAARMFALLGLHPGPDMTAAAAASLAGTEPPAADRAVQELGAASLLTEHQPGRYALHDLLRAYAAEHAEALDAGTRRAAVGRMLDHYLHTARAAALLLSPMREQVSPAPPTAGVTLEALASHQQALDWFEAEHQVLSAALQLAARTGFDTCAWQLAWAMGDYLRRIARWQELDVIERAGLAAATRLGDLAGQAAIRRRLGGTCVLLGDYPQASAHLSECLELYGRLGDRAGQANVHLDLGSAFEQQGRFADGLSHTEQALRHSQAAGYKAGQAAALSNIGWFQALLGDYEQARGSCWEALALFQELGSQHREAAVWDNLGYAEHHLGNLTEAAMYYQRSLALFRETGNRLFQAVILDHLGDNSRAAGDLDEARHAWQQALEIFGDLHRPDAENVQAKLGAALSLPTA
jgi:DNA-binding SARP family transcriptional activator/tetratricopeptide (TPR) repeat protein